MPTAQPTLTEGAIGFDLLVGALGLVAAFTSALLGVGGGIVMLPLLLYAPPLLGFPALDVRTATGLATAQVLFATVFGTVAHGRQGAVDRHLVLWVGAAMTAASVTAALLSGMVPGRVLLAVFAAVATIAGAIMFWPAAADLAKDSQWTGEFNRPLACLVGAVAGTLVGLVGSGTFVLSPGLLYALRVPTRVTIGTTLGIATAAALGATVGKAAAGLVPLEPAIAVLAGTLPGVVLGAHISRRLPPHVLRLLLAALITVIAVRAWWGLLH